MPRVETSQEGIHYEMLLLLFPRCRDVVLNAICGYLARCRVRVFQNRRREKKWEKEKIMNRKNVNFIVFEKQQEHVNFPSNISISHFDFDLVHKICLI